MSTFSMASSIFVESTCCHSIATCADLKSTNRSMEKFYLHSHDHQVVLLAKEMYFETENRYCIFHELSYDDTTFKAFGFPTTLFFVIFFLANQSSIKLLSMSASSFAFCF